MDLNEHEHAGSVCATYVKGFVKLNKFQKSEKNSEVGGWVKPQLGFLFFFGNSVFFVLLFLLYMFQRKKKWVGVWVGVVWTIRVFLGFLEFF